MTCYLSHENRGVVAMLFGLLWIASFIGALILVISGSTCITYEKYDSCFGTKNSAIIMTAVGGTFHSINFLVITIALFFVCYKNQRAETERCAEHNFANIKRRAEHYLAKTEQNDLKV